MNPFDAEARKIAAEFNRSLCDVRFLERVGDWEIYVGAGVWMTADYVRKLQEEADYAPRLD